MKKKNIFAKTVLGEFAALQSDEIKAPSFMAFMENKYICSHCQIIFHLS